MSGSRLPALFYLLEEVEAGLDVVERAAVDDRRGIHRLRGHVRGARITGQGHLALVLELKVSPVLRDVLDDIGVDLEGHTPP